MIAIREETAVEEGRMEREDIPAPRAAYARW